MSTAAMNSVSPDKAGAASGILSMSRMVGGTFGVAAIGALFQHLARTRLEDTSPGLPITAAQREHLVENLGSGSGGQLEGLDPALAAQVSTAAEGRVRPRALERHVALRRRERGGRPARVLVSSRRSARRSADPAQTAEAAEPLGV